MGEAMQEPAEPKMARLIGTMSMKLFPSIFNISRRTLSWGALPGDGRYTIPVLEGGIDLH
jgi:hypothetical protein